MGKRRSTRQTGFTLVEVLIAMAITVLIAGAAYAGVSTVLAGAEQLRSSGERVLEVNRALALMSRDLRFFINRPVQDEFGDLQPALAGGPLAFHPLMLTREGWHNGQELPRSNLQRVFYYLEDEALWRAYYPVLDRAVDAEPQRVRLLDEVEEFELRFLEPTAPIDADRDLVIDTRDWERNWAAQAGDQSAQTPPLAVEVRLQIRGVGEIRRFYALPRT